jgi:hypothetical protein
MYLICHLQSHALAEDTKYIRGFDLYGAQEGSMMQGTGQGGLTVPPQVVLQKRLWSAWG